MFRGGYQSFRGQRKEAERARAVRSKTVSIRGLGNDGGLDDRAQVLTGGKFVVVVFAMEVAS